VGGREALRLLEECEDDFESLRSDESASDDEDGAR
jgi:hypothetical protein